jgi:flagellar biosynthesis protein FlhG
MIDQATELRKLVLRAMRAGPMAHGPAPRLALLTSGRHGVGVTSLGVNASVALAEQGLRVVLVDADAAGAGVAALCGLSDGAANADLSVARHDIHAVLQRGPAGIQVVPCLRIESTEIELRPLTVERLMRQFAKLGRHTDSIIVDGGHGANDLVRRLAHSADDVIVVTTPDNASVADAYAHIKLTLSGNASRLWLVVNMTEGDEQAWDVHQRIRQSCERFLGHSIGMLGCIPRDAAVAAAFQNDAPFVLTHPVAAATQAVQRIAAEFAAGERQRQRPQASA